MITIIITGVIALIVGFVLGYLLINMTLKYRSKKHHQRKLSRGGSN